MPNFIEHYLMTQRLEKWIQLAGKLRREEKNGISLLQDHFLKKYTNCFFSLDTNNGFYAYVHRIHT